MRRLEVISSLKLHGNVEVLPAGFHSDVTLIVHNGEALVIKIISKPEFANKAVAEELAQDIVHYHHLLKDIGVRLPPINKIELLANGTNSWDVVVITPFLGYDAERKIKEKNVATTWALDGILQTMAPFFFNQQLCSHLEVGIDPKPANFVSKDNNEYHFIDWMPPRFRKNGIPLVEFAPPQSKEGWDLAYFRSYDAKGILLVLQTQMCRLSPASRPEIKSRILEFANSISPDVRGFLADLPSEKLWGLDFESSRNLIEGLGPRDVYALREIACELHHRHNTPAGAILVEQIFRLTHFFDDLPDPDKIEQAKSLLADCFKSTSSVLSQTA
ncbi:MAG: hypothetical protein UX72_C0055G0003 [Parcubacteria group bacterium GW2011_GWA2_47_10]|nr:MAG: hypothetical protein UX72_C0055G0003 [Parcubacteria group bacterium GW2011_GWA2_47_10]